MPRSASCDLLQLGQVLDFLTRERPDRIEQVMIGDLLLLEGRGSSGREEERSEGGQTERTAMVRQRIEEGIGRSSPSFWAIL